MACQVVGWLLVLPSPDGSAGHLRSFINRVSRNAKRLDRAHSFVGKIESGERQLNVRIATFGLSAMCRLMRFQSTTVLTCF
jgi:hypothetical protein